MSYSIVHTHTAKLAVAKLAPQGVSADDAIAKLGSVLGGHLGAIEFAEKSKKGGKPTRLKFNAKAKEASYASRMAGSTADVSAKAIDTYNWLFDCAEYEAQWGAMVHGDGLNVPKQIANWIADALATMKPAAEKPVATAPAVAVAS